MIEPAKTINTQEFADCIAELRRRDMSGTAGCLGRAVAIIRDLESERARAEAAEHQARLHQEAFVKAEERAVSLAAENAKLREAQRWISIAERLPRDGQEVLIVRRPVAGIQFSPGCCIFKRRNGIPLWCNDNWHRCVELDAMTHWMAMPDAPSPQKSPRESTPDPEVKESPCPS